MRRTFHTLLILWAGTAGAAPFELQYVGVNGKPYGGVVVSLRSTDASRPLARPAPAKMDQVARQFAPHVLVIPVGSPVSFPNSDTVAHQVYSYTRDNSFGFELPLYSGKPPPPVVFDQPGTFTLGCNIHDQMRAYVYVVEAQYFGRADHDGRWKSPNVEPGEYQLTIWHPLYTKQVPVLEQRVTVTADGTKLALRAEKKLSLKSESQVPANWDVY